MRVSVALIRLCALLTLADAQADEPFYKGKRLTMVINFGSGGPADIEGRLFAKHIGKHIEGNPSVIVQNIDGAGGLIGTNYLGEIAPRDGQRVRPSHRHVLALCQQSGSLSRGFPQI